MTAERYWENRWRDEVKNRVEIRKHEREAMMSLVLVSRALASQLVKNDMTQAVRLQVWAQMVEDVVERMEGDK